MQVFNGIRAKSLRVCALTGAVCAAWPANALDVAVAGVFASKAVLVIDGGAPQTVAVGRQTREGVRVKGVNGDSVTIEHAGRSFVARVGDRVANAGGTSLSEISLLADGGGHFFTEARINGGPVRVVVDTGATFVSMGRNEAARLGIDYQSGVVGQSATANGLVRVWKVKLDTVELRGLRLHGVDAAVHDSELPVVLLGMSFMNRMDWRREGNTLMLRKRY